jgi:hypothetical protein
MIRHLSKGIVAAFACVCAAGCENVDWNWDTTWWQKPQRVVRPSRPVQKPVAPGERAAKTAESPSRAAAERPAPPRPETQPASVEEAPRRPMSGVTEAAPIEPADVGRPAAAVDATPNAAMPFYHLYLVSGVEPKEAQPGEYRVALRYAPARACAAALEILHVPMGRSGSENESYLIYEDVDQFQAAKEMAVLLDEPPAEPAASTVGAEGAFKAGIAELLRILDQGVQVDAKTIDACERHLAEALQSSELSTAKRWAAGLLAGRLVSEYKYDYVLARSYYRQAGGLVAPAALESLALWWWTADAFAQEGKSSDARAIYQAIVKTYGERWDKSQVVRRAKSRSEQKSKG